MKIPQLTFTRFLAAISIVVFHYRNQAYPFTVEPAHSFINFFNVQVSYFFLLSGFILTITSGGKVEYGKFYLNRFSRIYPVYIGALVLTLGLMLAARNQFATFDFQGILLSGLLAQAWSSKYALVYNYPAWSLSVEAFFYLLFPFIYHFFQKITLRNQLLVAAVFWVIMQVLFFRIVYSNNAYVLYHPVFHLSTFVFGIAGGELFKHKQELIQMHKRGLQLLFLAFCLIIGVLIFQKNQLFEMIYHNGLLAPAFLLFIYIVSTGKSKIFQWFSHPKLQYLGEISYSIYILQIPTSILVAGVLSRTVQVSETIFFYIYLPVLLVVSAISYELIEKPSRQFLRNRFNKPVIS